MDQNGVAGFRHRRSPSSDRFLDVFSPPPSGSSLGGASTGYELNEDDVFWTGGDFSETHRRSESPSKTHLRSSFVHPEKSGILAALPEDYRKPGRPVLYRKASIVSSSSPSSSLSPSFSPTPPSFSRAIPSIPKPPVERDHNGNFSQSMPARKFQNSAPMNVPMMSRKQLPRNGDLADVDVDDDGDDEMLPPHEIVARGSARSPKTTFSVLEGVGRTLKGRDLRQVRNAVFRQTGFLD